MLHRTRAVGAATALTTATTALVLAVALATPAHAAPRGAQRRHDEIDDAHVLGEAVRGRA